MGGMGEQRLALASGQVTDFAAAPFVAQQALCDDLSLADSARSVCRDSCGAGRTALVANPTYAANFSGGLLATPA